MHLNPTHWSITHRQDWYQSSYLTLGKKVNKCISQKFQLFQGEKSILLRSKNKHYSCQFWYLFYQNLKKCTIIMWKPASTCKGNFRFPLNVPFSVSSSVLSHMWHHDSSAFLWMFTCEANERWDGGRERLAAGDPGLSLSLCLSLSSLSSSHHFLPQPLVWLRSDGEFFPGLTNVIASEQYP